MNLFQIVIFIGLIGNSSIGLFVILSNPKRAANRSFFLLTSFMTLWMGAMFFCSFRYTDAILLFWIRITSAFASLIPIGVATLHLGIIKPNVTFAKASYELRFWLIITAGIIALCFSPIFVVSATNPTPEELVPPTVYDWGFWIFIAFFIAATLILSLKFRAAAKTVTGAQKGEIQFLQIGCISSFAIGISLISGAEILKDQEISLFVPLSVLALDGFVAYGIATRRILSTSTVLQRILALGLMALYLSLIYTATAWIGFYTYRWFVNDPAFLSYLTATLVVAFSVAPVHGWMQAFSHRLIPNQMPVNSDDVLKQARSIFQEVSAERNLTESFAYLVMRTFGTPVVTVFRPGGDKGFIQRYPECAERCEPMRLNLDDALIALLHRENEPVTLDMLERIRASALTVQSRRSLEIRASTVAAGCFMRNELKAVILLSARENGRIYDLHDQRTLQLLCDQFAVALENSSLYTEVQNARIYNDILLNSLTSGIVAVSADRMVTVFNKRAQDLTGLGSPDVVDHPVSVLPDALAEGLDTILNTQAGFRDQDTVIQTANGVIPIRVSGEIFHSHTSQLLGALVIFTDLTELKQMEAQIRRSDRLSSIGTLSAGMAHEIKNPLVTIKTFTQLLPDQYKDEEFRQTFFTLVGQEVKRIDTIVNRLLNFARPATANLLPLSLHDVVDGSLQLIAQQLAQNGITLERHLDADRHRISADANQLNQAFINFLLNAVHAMKDGGTLTVRTSLHHAPLDAPHLNGSRNGYFIRLDIEDTGCGIPPENLDRIFDPFFTTKEFGVGLGLSVSHGIIEEHKGIIHVESHLNRGTLFQIHFPLLAASQTEDHQ